MKIPAKFIAALCVLTLGYVSPVLRAEDGAPESTPETKPANRPQGNPGDMLKDKLGLTDAQAEQMRAVRQETDAQLKALKANTALSMDERKAEFMKIRDAAKAKTDAILTPEQQAKFAKIREAMQQSGGDHKPGQGPGAGQGQGPGAGAGQGQVPGGHKGPAGAKGPQGDL
jgi:Spy/CpxP family protein refolding chaperone